MREIPLIAINPFLLYGNLSGTKLTEEMKRHAVTASLVEKHSNLEVSAFVKLAQSLK